MTLYYTLVFLVLVAEMAIFLMLIVPMPKFVHRKVIRGLRTPAMTRVIASLKFLFIFILVLFIDSVQRVFKATDVQDSTLTMADRSDIQARKFYNQRNMYLCGFTLFLSLILNRTFSLVKRNSDLRSQLGTDAKGDTSLRAADYKERLERKKKQFKALEEQSEQLQKEYYRVCDELQELKGEKRKDGPKKDE